jgi:very-short-patch-repair endonuclease
MNMDEKTYQERVQSAKDRWETMSALKKENMMQAAIKAIQLAGKEGSKLEKFIRDELAQQGYKVEAHKKTIIQNENLEIDMYFPDLNTIIEIDGPSHFLPIWGEEKLQKQIRADAHKTGLILSKGMAIIRVKTLSDSLSLSEKETLKNRLLETLSKIQNNFPKKSERYIEIDT